MIGVPILHGVGSQRTGSQFDGRLCRALNSAAGRDVTVVAKTACNPAKSRDRQREFLNHDDRHAVNDRDLLT